MSNIRILPRQGVASVIVDPRHDTNHGIGQRDPDLAYHNHAIGNIDPDLADHNHGIGTIDKYSPKFHA